MEAGVIKPLIASLVGGKLSAIAQEHAVTVLSGLASIGDNAQSIKDGQHARVGKVAPVAHLGDIRHASEAAASLK